VTIPLADLDSWDRVPALIREAEGRPPASCQWFRIGDVFLELRSDHDPLLQEFETAYGDCAVPAPAPGAPRVRCAAGILSGWPLLFLSFDGPGALDALETARSPQRFFLRQRYLEVAGPLPGWRQLVDAEDRDRMLIASDGKTVLLCPHEAQFAVDCIVGTVQSSQAGVLFLHAASVGIAGAGALIIGPGGAGKSTTALTLAWRGHSFLGDDVAAVRRASGEVLPFPKSAGLRDGPLARSLDARLRDCRRAVVTTRRGVRRTLVRVGDLFPGTLGGPLPLRFAFLLDGFADRARITACRPQLSDVKRLQSVATDRSLAWGISPGRDLMSLLVVVELLSRVTCHLVQLGSPEETAGLIEAAMEVSCS